LYRRWMKRWLDAGLAAAGLIGFALPMAWIAFRIRRESGRPVLFHQARVGRNGRRFIVHKFRSMTADGTTTYGKKLRGSAMDELPQLINILRGEMSFVGPRPLIPEELEKLDRIPNGERRLELRPGLAGLAQLRCAKVPHLPERLRWDLIYLERLSLGLDLWILLQSVGVTLRRAWEPAGPGKGR